MGCGASAKTKYETTEAADSGEIVETKDAAAGAKAGQNAKAHKRFSQVSEEALGQLNSTNDDLTAIEDRVEEIAQAMRNDEAEISRWRTELAQLESRAKQLETTKVDHVYTGELNSGKQIARESKKDMLQRLDVLLARIEDIFAGLKQQESTLQTICDSNATGSKSGPLPRAGSRLSQSSDDALDRLGKTSDDLSMIEARVQEIAHECKLPGASWSNLRSELGQLETRAKQLETTGVDDVYTGELSSGKQVAKETKKDMLRRLDALFAQIDSVFADARTLATTPSH